MLLTKDRDMLKIFFITILFAISSKADLPQGHFEAYSNNSNFDLFIEKLNQDNNFEALALLVNKTKKTVDIYKVEEVAPGLQAWITIYETDSHYLSLEPNYNALYKSDYLGEQHLTLRIENSDSNCAQFDKLKFEKVSKSSWKPIPINMRKLIDESEDQYVEIRSEVFKADIKVGDVQTSGPLHIQKSINEYVGVVRRASLDLNSPEGLSLEQNILSLMYYIEDSKSEKILLTNQISEQCNSKYTPFKKTWSRVWWGD